MTKSSTGIRDAQLNVIAEKDAYLLAQPDLGKVPDHVISERSLRKFGMFISKQFVKRCRRKQKPPIRATAKGAPRVISPNEESIMLLTWGRAFMHDDRKQPVMHYTERSRVRQGRSHAMCCEKPRPRITRDESLVSCVSCKLALRLAA